MLCVFTEPPGGSNMSDDETRDDEGFKKWREDEYDGSMPHNWPGPDWDSAKGLDRGRGEKSKTHTDARNSHRTRSKKQKSTVR